MPKLVAITAIVIAICFTFVQGSFAQGTSAATYPMPAYTTSGFQSVPPQQPVPMFEIMNVMHGQGLAAGNVDNNSVYLQDPAGRANARWVLISADNGAGNYYYIVDTLHRQALVAGNNYDGHVYHQPDDNRDNAQWSLVPGSTPGAFQLIDHKHGRAIVAGNVNDGNVYHQDATGRLNAEWRLVAVQTVLNVGTFFPTVPETFGGAGAQARATVN